MEIINPKILFGERKEWLAELHGSPHPPAEGVHLFHAVLAVKSTRTPGVGCWLFVADFGCNAFRRLAIPWRDLETTHQVKKILDPWDLIEVTARATSHGNIECKIRLIEKCPKGSLFPKFLLEKWCAPLSRRGKLGWPLVSQIGTGHRLMVAGLTPKGGLDAADFTQAYAGVTGLQEFADRLLNLDALNAFQTAAAKDRRPAIQEFSAFQEFIAAIGPDYSKPTPLPHVLYTWLHRHPDTEAVVGHAESAQDLERQRTFREIFCRFKPELVLVCGKRATHEIGAILESLGPNTRIQLAKLRQPDLIGRDDFWRRAIFVEFGPRPFSGITAFVPIYDLHYFGQARAGSNPVPQDYWSNLAEFVGHWIDDSLPKEEVEIDERDFEVVL